MVKFLRYSVAALFFAASVGCLWFWVVSLHHHEVVYKAERISPARGLHLEALNGHAILATTTDLASRETQWRFVTYRFPGPLERPFTAEYSKGHFGTVGEAIYFPLWYPALVFALAGVGVLRFRRQFSIRSALIGLAVVAALLGMVVAL